MSEPSPSPLGAAAASGLGPPGLLRWPTRPPLNQRPGKARKPDIPAGEQFGGEPLAEREVSPEPRPQAAPAAAGRLGISVPDTDRLAQPDTAPDKRTLGRPGPPALAGAAIAGLLLVVAPFAMSAMQRPETLATVPVTAGGGGLRADGSGSDTTGAGGGGQDSAGPEGSNALAGGSGGDSGQPDRGYVPAPPEGAGAGAGNPAQDAAGGGSGPGNEPGQQEGAPDGGQNLHEGGLQSNGAPATGEPADGEDGGDGDTAKGDDGGGESEEGGNGGDSAGGDKEGDGDGGNPPDGGSGGDGGGDPPKGDGGDGGDPVAPMMADGSPSADPSPSGDAESSPSASESPSSSAPAFTAVTGPGCPSAPGAAYGTAGREGEDAARWATRDGGYGRDGCDGAYDAIPVSGTSEHGDGKYAYWSFTPGFTEAECDIFVYVPEDGSPRWVSDREAMYQIFPGPDPSGDAAAVFGVKQAESKGGWVKVTGFVSPNEQFTVQLTNIGENAVADQAGKTSHVAASAVRTRCS